MNTDELDPAAWDARLAWAHQHDRDLHSSIDAARRIAAVARTETASAHLRGLLSVLDQRYRAAHAEGPDGRARGRAELAAELQRLRQALGEACARVEQATGALAIRGQPEEITAAALAEVTSWRHLAAGEPGTEGR